MPRARPKLRMPSLGEIVAKQVILSEKQVGDLANKIVKYGGLQLKYGKTGEVENQIAALDMLTEILVILVPEKKKK